MKTIYLQNKDWSKSEFNFENIEDLIPMLTEREIKIGLRLKIGYRASIGDDVKIIQSFFIEGSKHGVTYTGNNTLSIGYHNYTIDKWLEKFEIVGKKENYSDSEIKEYKSYIDFANLFHKINYTDEKGS